MSRALLELRAVLQDASLAGNAEAVRRLGRQLAEQLGVAQAGADEHGLWIRLEVEAAGPEASARLRWVSPGAFLMGSPEGDAEAYPNEKPRHEVVLTEGFWLGETPVTQALWIAVMGDNPSEFKSPGRPVECVSWSDCQRFCERLAQLCLGLHPRLPTEAEWEYAARAGTTTPRHGELDDIAWHSGNSALGATALERQPDEGTHLVGLKQPNDWGLHDMLGNVFEWCQDQMEAGASYELGSAVLQDTSQQPSAEPQRLVDPLSKQGWYRVLRGGSWYDDARFARAAFRNANTPGLASGSLGFRLAGGRVLQRGGVPTGPGEAPDGVAAGAAGGADSRNEAEGRRRGRRQSLGWGTHRRGAMSRGFEASQVLECRHGLGELWSSSMCCL